MAKETPKTVIKPWGKEIWLELNDKYCYKRLYINAGTRTSFQYHNQKIETNYIIAGEAEIWLENDKGEIEKTIRRAGDFFNVTPPQKHRVIAITDLILQEVSTPEVDDVIRIEDDHQRGDGRIQSEHIKGQKLSSKKSSKKSTKKSSKKSSKKTRSQPKKKNVKAKKKTSKKRS